MSGEYRNVKGLSIKNSKINGLNVITLANKIKSGFIVFGFMAYGDEILFVL